MHWLCMRIGGPWHSPTKGNRWRTSSRALRSRPPGDRGFVYPATPGSCSQLQRGEGVLRNNNVSRTRFTACGPVCCRTYSYIDNAPYSVAEESKQLFVPKTWNVNATEGYVMEEARTARCQLARTPDWSRAQLGLKRESFSASFFRTRVT